MNDTDTAQSETTGEHLADILIRHGEQEECSYLNPRYVEYRRVGDAVEIHDRDPERTYSNTVVLAYEVLKGSGIPMALRMEREPNGKPYVVCGTYTQVQHAARMHVKRLDADLETLTDDLRQALAYGAAHAITLHGADAYEMTAERHLWRELERTGDLPDVLGQAIQELYRSGEGGSTNAMHNAANAASRKGRAAFVRSACQLALNGDVLPRALINRLFTL